MKSKNASYRLLRLFLHCSLLFSSQRRLFLSGFVAGKLSLDLGVMCAMVVRTVFKPIFLSLLFADCQKLRAVFACELSSSWKKRTFLLTARKGMNIPSDFIVALIERLIILLIMLFSFSLVIP